MSERRRPDLDQVRESMREHDERSEDDAEQRPEPEEPPAEDADRDDED